MESEKKLDNNQGERQKSEAEKVLGSMPSFKKYTQKVNAVSLISETERSVESLKEQVIDMTTAEEGVLASDFESGVYLFHSSEVRGIKEILESGELLNAGEIYERKLAATREKMLAEGKSEEEIREEQKKIVIRGNSGQEGISWSANGIDAMPGTRGRIAGFVAAPELVLGDDKLVIPSRTAPYELLQVSSDISTEEFFKAKKQFEVWGYKEISFGEQATVDSGLMRLRMNVEYGGDDAEGFYGSHLKNFAERGGLPVDELRKHFKILEDGHVELDTDLHQQQFDENYIPPAAVYIQAMIDQGLLKDTVLAGKDVVGIINACREDSELIFQILNQGREEGLRYKGIYEAELSKSERVSVKVEDMYFVTSHKDLDEWIEIMKKTGHMPRGILLYDDEKIVKENFASEEKGDHGEMAAEIGRVVGADNEFWSKKIGMDIEGTTRAGHRGQTLKDSEVSHGVEVKMVNGKLEVVKNGEEQIKPEA